MRMWHSLALSLGLLLAACNNSTLPPFEMRLQPVITAGLSSPIDLQAPPGDSRLFIAERPGRIRVVQNGALLAMPFLDISSRVLSSSDTEAGLLSFAFDPQFSTNGFVYVHFVENIGTFGEIVVERYQVSSGNPNLLDVSSMQL